MRAIMSLVFISLLGLAGYQGGHALGLGDPIKYGEIFGGIGAFLGWMILFVTRQKAF